MLQQYLPLAVLKLFDIQAIGHLITNQLQQYLPLAVLKLRRFNLDATFDRLQQYLPLAVLKQFKVRTI